MGFFLSESKNERHSKNAESKKTGSGSGGGSGQSSKSTKSELAHTLKYSGQKTSNTVKNTKKGLFDLFS